GGVAERHDLAPGLELAEEEDVVDQLPRLLDLLACLLHQRVDVGARQRRVLEQHEEARERRPQLVRDGGGEADPQLLIRRELGQGVEEEHHDLRVSSERLLGEASAGDRPLELCTGSVARSDDVPFAVEDDDGLVRRVRDSARLPDPRVVHHSFTIQLPSPNRVSTDNEASMPKVLIVEDDEVIAEGMARHLGAAGFDPVSVGNGTQGLARLRYEKPDVCVLDLMLPGIDGWKLIETARSEGIGTPIVVVSARGTEHDRVHALEIGADDYLVKPFSMKELVARVRAAARRALRREETPRGEPI